jgi:hypothetical protein
VKKVKTTKQGVRDLNDIPSKPKGKKLDPVPEAADADSGKGFDFSDFGTRNSYR